MAAAAAPMRVPGMLDANLRVRGRVPYAMDLNVVGMLHAKLLRSPYAHARIVSVDASRARALSGVRAVLTGADLAERDDIYPYYGPIFRDQAALAMDKVRFAGDPVAAVAADDADIAQAALELIDVEYEELPAVFDVDAALAAGAPIVHDEPPRLGQTFADIIVRAEADTNICNHFKLRKGDVERAFAEADHVFENEFTSPPVQHVPMETHNCVAWIDAGIINVTTATQMPFAVRASLAEIFRVSQAKVRITTPTLGGGYGAKTYTKVEPIAALLAQAAGRPVRIHLTREEEFVTITKHGVKIRMKTGVTNDARIVARQSTCWFNTGAYADIGPRLIKNGGYATGGPHDIPNVWVDSYAVYTNLPPAGAFRGYGVSQAAWAYETQMDMIAAQLGWDPLEFRMKNLLEDGQAVMTGEDMFDAHFKELLGSAAERIGWDSAEQPQRTGSKVRAKGLACIIKGTVTPSTSTAAAKLNEDGSLQILSSAVEMGQGAETALSVLAAEGLDLRLDQVSISRPDTDVTPYDQGTSSSRNTYSMGTAVRMAVGDIRTQLLELAAAELEASPDDLELVAGRVQPRGVPDKSIAYGDLVRGSRSGNLLANGVYASKGGLDPETGQGIGSVHWHQAAAAVEVEVDLDTGKIDLLKYHAGVYAGRIVNPVQAELQTEGNIAFGLGQALFEEMIFDGGQLQNGNLGDYMIASMEDMPKEISLGILEHIEANDIHGIGETSLPPAMPAIGNAVYRATGVRITDLPITPEKVLRGLRARAAQESAE
ncbi:MAG: xanthine dehydrogenase family protein molybdopterin-binding subunit [Candidatus Limnocylindrales bacterium]|nr:xanthine dehydrogenase family protein molybdopterin-binding subunit [Candidatus Limnocylindrales bacterium]